MSELATRYSGIQTHLKNISEYGCHFLTLCSIAEEATNTKIDLIDAVNKAISNNLIDNEYTVLNNIALLQILCNNKYKWVETRVRRLPATIKDNEYTECVYTFGRSIHYRRRAVDTIINSNTVANGQITEYRIYTCEEE